MFETLYSKFLFFVTLFCSTDWEKTETALLFFVIFVQLTISWKMVPRSRWRTVKEKEILTALFTVLQSLL